MPPNNKVTCRRPALGDSTSALWVVVVQGSLKLERPVVKQDAAGKDFQRWAVDMQRVESKPLSEPWGERQSILPSYSELSLLAFSHLPSSHVTTAMPKPPML